MNGSKSGDIWTDEEVQINIDKCTQLDTYITELIRARDAILRAVDVDAQKEWFEVLTNVGVNPRVIMDERINKAFERAKLVVDRMIIWLNQL